MVLEKTLESPLDQKKIKPVNPQGNQSWIFIGRTDAEAEAPILGPPDVNHWLTGKDPDAGKDWSQKEKGWQRKRWLDSITDSMGMNLSKLETQVRSWGQEIPWRKEWKPIPVFMSGKSHGQRSLVGYIPWVANSRTWLSNEHTYTGDRKGQRSLALVHEVSNSWTQLSDWTASDNKLFM